MTNPYSDAVSGSLTVFCRKVTDKLDANKQSLGLADVFYSDQTKIPRTPTLCIEPDEKRRELEGAPRRTLNTLSLYGILYFSKVQDVQLNAAQALEMAEGIETFLHADPTLDGMLIHSYCTSIEPGYRTREGTQFRACRITYQGITKTMLGM